MQFRNQHCKKVLCRFLVLFSFVLVLFCLFFIVPFNFAQFFTTVLFMSFLFFYSCFLLLFILHRHLRCLHHLILFFHAACIDCSSSFTSSSSAAGYSSVSVSYSSLSASFPSSSLLLSYDSFYRATSGICRSGRSKAEDNHHCDEKRTVSTKTLRSVSGGGEVGGWGRLTRRLDEVWWNVGPTLNGFKHAVQMKCTVMQSRERYATRFTLGFPDAAVPLIHLHPHPRNGWHRAQPQNSLKPGLVWVLQEL